MVLFIATRKRKNEGQAKDEGGRRRARIARAIFVTLSWQDIIREHHITFVFTASARRWLSHLALGTWHTYDA